MGEGNNSATKDSDYQSLRKNGWLTPLITLPELRQEVRMPAVSPTSVSSLNISYNRS
jgi:hypothetical protein